MGHADYLKLGSANAICDTCGFKYKLSELRLDWRGLMLCERCWEPRHPQEFLRGVPDKPSEGVENPRPDSTPVFFAPVTTISTPTLPSSGVPVENTNLMTVNIAVSGGADVSVTIDGWPATIEAGYYQLAPKSQIVLTYSSAPTWTWYAE